MLVLLPARSLLSSKQTANSLEEKLITDLAYFHTKAQIIIVMPRVLCAKRSRWEGALPRLGMLVFFEKSKRFVALTDRGCRGIFERLQDM